VPSSLKTEFLELLTQLTKEGKTIHLYTYQRVQLIQLLLNDTVKYFDFDVLDCTKEAMLDVYNYPKKRNMDITKIFEFWRRFFDFIWTELGSKCPKLQQIREMGPNWDPARMNYSLCPRLNSNVFNFTNMISLETNSYLFSGL